MSPMTQGYTDLRAEQARKKQIGGDHYNRLTIQPIDYYESVSADSEHYEGFLRFNAMKYLSRYTEKGGLQDVRKALHYCELLDGHLTKRSILSRSTDIEDR